MNTLTKGIAVAVIHLLIVGSLGAKLLYDRAHRPRVWVHTDMYDPELPIRGRYMTLRLEVQAPWFAPKQQYETSQVTLGAENGQLVAYKAESTNLTISQSSRFAPVRRFWLDQPVDFFLPEHAELPRIAHGEEIWAEVTIPRKGPPRPIQLAIKNGSVWMPLTYR